MEWLSKFLKPVLQGIGSAISILVLGYIISLVIGFYSPTEYQVIRSKSYEMDQNTVWGILRNLDQYPKWKPWVSKVELLGRVEDISQGIEENPDRLRFREHMQAESSDYYVDIDDEDQIIKLKVIAPRKSRQMTWIFRVDTHEEYTVLHVKYFVKAQKIFDRFEVNYVDTPLEKQVAEYLVALEKEIKRIQKMREEDAEAMY